MIAKAKIIAASICLAALSGCALPPLSKPVLRPTQELAAVPVTIGGAGGHQVVTSVIVPPDACSQDGYVSGFKVGFINQWNPAVGSKASLFGMRKGNPVYAHNWGLYQGKNVVSGDDIATNKQYGPGRLFDESPAARCAAVSYMKGQNRGQEFAQIELRKLENQEH